MATTFYPLNDKSAVTASEYLEKAMEHLVKLTKTQYGWVTHGVMYARVMALLGKPTALVEDEYKKAISVCVEDKYLIKAREQLGCYYLARNSYKQARSQFEMAVKISGKRYYLGHVAKRGLELVGQLLQH